MKTILEIALFLYDAKFHGLEKALTDRHEASNQLCSTYLFTEIINTISGHIIAQIISSNWAQSLIDETMIVILDAKRMHRKKLRNNWMEDVMEVGKQLRVQSENC